MLPSRGDAWSLLCEYTPNENPANMRSRSRPVCSRTRVNQEQMKRSGALQPYCTISTTSAGRTTTITPRKVTLAPGSASSASAATLKRCFRPSLGRASYTGVARETPLAHALFACDEMAGFLTACSLVKPGKTIFEGEPDSWKRRMKDKAFARGVSRNDLVQGAQELGVSIEQHIATCIAAMREIATALGLERK